MALVIEHGAGGYRRGCRCETCKAGNAARVASRRAALREGAAPSRKRRRGLRSVPDLAVTEGAEIERLEAGQRPEGQGYLEARISSEIEDLATGKAWTSECDRLEAQALTAARIVDACMVDGRLHLTTPQHRVIDNALDRLRAILAPVRPAAGMSELDVFLQGLTMMPRERTE